MKSLALLLALLPAAAQAKCAGEVVFACTFARGQQSLEICLTGQSVTVAGTGQDMALASGGFDLGAAEFTQVTEGGRVVREQLAWPDGNMALIAIQARQAAGLRAVDPAGVPIDFVCDPRSELKGGFKPLAAAYEAAGYKLCASGVWQKTCR